MNIVFISRVKMNPYVNLLADALQTSPEVKCTILDDLSPRWLWQKRKEIDILHFHWLELLYASSTWHKSSLKWFRLIQSLLLAKLAGIGVIYTIHNLEAHESEYALLNRWGNILFSWLADAIHVHDEQTRQAVAKHLGRHYGVVVIPHGNYLSYPNTCTQEEARSRLGLPLDAFVYLFLGQIRPYKGIEELLKAFARLSDRDSVLIIAGHIHDRLYGERIGQLAEKDERIMVKPGYVPPQDLQYFMNACDICVLPYRHVTTSGAAILAFSFGKPIIAPRLGSFPELVEDQRGLLYDPYDEDALFHALQKARLMDITLAGEKARSLALELDWIAIAHQHLRVYQQCLTAKRRQSGDGSSNRSAAQGQSHD